MTLQYRLGIATMGYRGGLAESVQQVNGFISIETQVESYPTSYKVEAQSLSQNVEIDVIPYSSVSIEYTPTVEVALEIGDIC